MSYDYKKLAGRIVEIFGTQGKFAEAMNKSERTISLKMNNRIDWTQDEMIRASDILKFPLSEIPLYFFALEVQY